jgi:nucleoporin NDC1
LFSAYLFSEIYIWSASKNADLNRIKMIRNTERPILNERPIYLTCFLYFVAIAQTGFHLYYDYDRIDMPILKTKVQGSSSEGAHSVVTPEVQLKSKFLPLAMSALYRSVVMALVSPFIYSLTVRDFAWGFTRSFAKYFWSLPKSNALPSVRPFHWGLLMRTVSAGFLLTMLWEVGNAAFSAYVAQEPLKNDRPITYESRDPNGSLLTGLKGKKLQTRVSRTAVVCHALANLTQAFAFWELAYIAERFQGRRKVIYEDIDRKGGSTWSQILATCLETITAIDKRIAEYNGMPEPAKKKEEPIPELPQIGTPLKDGISKSGDLFEPIPRPKSRGAGVVRAFDTISKSLGQSPPRSSPTASKLLTKAENAVLTPKQKEEVAKGGFGALFRDKATWFLQTNFGWPFRQTYRRRITTVVLGSPFGDIGIVVDAIDSLTRLAVCSLQEDKYGNVQRDVKKIIQTLTATVTKLEKFKLSIGVHWTDVEKKQECPEVDIILTALKSGLNQLIEAFGNYSEDLRLSQSEMRLAREAATPAPARKEMEENK